MESNLRFEKATDNARPFKSHRYDLYGPKIQRSLTLFGRTQIDFWILLESNPQVLAYCERPLIVTDVKPKLIVDFWVKYAKSEELWLIKRDEVDKLQIDKAFPSFVQWAKTKKLVPRFVLMQHFPVNRAFLENWGSILRDISANKRYVKPKLIKDVREILSQPRSISSICNCIPFEDPVLVRVAIYLLLHSGVANCMDLKESLIGPNSIVELL